MTTTFARERTLQEEIAPAVESRVPGVEVLAVELVSPSRFCVYIDHAERRRPCALRARHARSRRVPRRSTRSTCRRPGPSGPLRRPEHFADAVGAARRRPASRAAGRTDIAASCVEAGDDAITLQTRPTPATIRIPYDAIVRANLIDEGLTT